MENQEVQPTQAAQPLQPTPPIQPIISHEKPKTNFTIIGLVVLACLIIFGFSGYYLGKTTSTPKPNTNQNQPSAANSPETNLIQTSPTLNTTSPAVALKKYTSKFEKISFEYPQTWKVVKPKMESSFPEGDALSIESPSGKIIITWVSGIDGIGGSCDPNVALGSEGEMGAACPLYEVVDKQKLPNADLYYVAYIVTRDGINYDPIFALQDSTGILTSKRTMGYLMFKGKNNGGAAVEMSGEPSKSGLVHGTKDEVKKFFTTTEAIEAKNILLSVSY